MDNERSRLPSVLSELEKSAFLQMSRKHSKIRWAAFGAEGDGQHDREQLAKCLTWMTRSGYITSPMRLQILPDRFDTAAATNIQCMLRVEVAQMGKHLLVRLILAFAACPACLAGAHADTITLERLEKISNLQESNPEEQVVPVPQQPKGVASLPGSSGVSIEEMEDFPATDDFIAVSSDPVTSSRSAAITGVSAEETNSGAAKDSEGPASAGLFLSGAPLIFGASVTRNPKEIPTVPDSGSLLRSTQANERFSSNVKPRKEHEQGEIVNDVVPAPEPASLVLLGLGLSVIAVVGRVRKRRPSSDLLW